MGKIIILLSLIFTPSLWAYDPFAKVECRKRTSASEFVYFEISPASLSGHHGHLELFKNNELSYKQDFRLYLDSQNSLFRFESEAANIEFNIKRVDVKSGDRFKGNFVSKTTISPVQSVQFDCDYFFVEDEE
jgi:hypothetical protein